MPNLHPQRPITRCLLSAQPDERLVRLVREGYEPAFEEIVRRYRGPLVGFATAIVSANGAEDVVQASLAKAYAALLGDGREIKLRPWLFSIVRNGCLNAIRGEPRVDEIDDTIAAHSDPSDIAEQREDLDRLVVAMCALPEVQRQALVKRELEGIGHSEIASQLGTTATAVRGLIFRARTQLRDAVGLLVPLPALRLLLAQGSTAGAATGVLGGGASAALLGGPGAKGAAMIAAAVLAFGSGIALEKHNRGSTGGDSAAAATAADRDRGAGAAGATATVAAASPAAARKPASPGGSGDRSRSIGNDEDGSASQGGGQSGTGGSGSDGDSGPGSDSSGSGSDSSGSGSSGAPSGGGSTGGHDGPSGEAPEPSEDHGDDPGSEQDEGSDEVDYEPPEQDHSGPSEDQGSSGDDGFETPDDD